MWGDWHCRSLSSRCLIFLVWNITKSCHINDFIQEKIWYCKISWIFPQFLNFYVHKNKILQGFVWQHFPGYGLADEVHCKIDIIYVSVVAFKLCGTSESSYFKPFGLFAEVSCRAFGYFLTLVMVCWIVQVCKNTNKKSKWCPLLHLVSLVS